MIRVRSFLLGVGASVLSAPLVAQGRSAVSVEASVGLGVIEAARSHQDHVGVSVDALVGWRLRRELGQTGLLALSAATQGSLGSTGECELAPGGGCAPNYSRFHTIAALVGWEGRALFGVPLRVLAGPAYFRARSRSGGSAGGLGLQERVDIATPALRRVAVVASLRGGFPFSRLDGRAYRVGAIAVGLRVQ